MEDPSTHQAASDHLEAKSEAKRKWALVAVDHSSPENPSSLRSLPNSHRIAAVAVAVAIASLHCSHPQAAVSHKWH